MATLGTFVANQVLTAAELNAIGTFAGYTPALSQSASVSKTVTRARYVQFNDLLMGDFNLAVTGSGTSSNVVLIGLPFTAAVSDVNNIVGDGFVYDVSAATKYRGLLVMHSSSSMKFLTLHSTTDGYLGSTDFTAGLASGDTVAGRFYAELA
jgi:hypothetical protein